MAKVSAPFGSWPSSISASMVAGQSIRFGSLMCSEGFVYWSESRPEEGGRSVIMRGCAGAGGDNAGDAPKMLLPAPYSARSGVHEYGGGEFLAIGDEIFFVNADDQDIYRFAPGDDPERVTNEPDLRFADFCYDPVRERLIAVGERTHKSSSSSRPSSHSDDAHQYPQNLLVSVALGGGAVGEVRDLVTGFDFFSNPRLSPDCKKLAWLAWDLPNMPWESAALYMTDLDEKGDIGSKDRIAGGDGVSICQPEWSESGELYFISDESDWGNLNKWSGDGITAVAPMEADCGRPQWVFGVRSYALGESGEIAVSAIQDGQSALKIVDAEGDVETLDLGLTSVENIAPLYSPDGFGYVAIVTTDQTPAAIAFIARDGEIDIIRRSADVSIEPNDISQARVIAFRGDQGDEVFGQYYPPTNKSCVAPDGALPPAILGIHGGPSGMANRGFQWKVQYWTSRGFGFFDIDYSGSTGYGRAYRERLDGQWGVRDIADVICGGQHLIDAGLCHPDHLFVSGGSSGGYGVLMALARSDIFAAGACYYGISDLNQLLKFTHKFEGGYTYRLTGTTVDDHEAVLSDRSPLTHISEIKSPLIVFQGLDDRVVPPAQSEMIVDGLRARNITVEYYEFKGEGHGFRKADTIVTALEAELAFYSKVFGV